MHHTHHVLQGWLGIIQISRDNYSCMGRLTCNVCLRRRRYKAVGRPTAALALEAKAAQSVEMQEALRFSLHFALSAKCLWVL